MEYLTLKEYSKKTGISVRTLRDRCKKGGYYQTEKNYGKGGEQYLIADTSTTCVNTEILKEFQLDKTGNIQASQSDITNEKEKEIALNKAALIDLYYSFLKNFAGKKQDATNLFLSGYNSALTAPEIYAVLGKVSTRSLYRWIKTFEESGNDYFSLYRNYNYASSDNISTLLTVQERVLLLKYMLHQNKFSLGRAYELIKFECCKSGIEVRSYSSYARVWNYLQKNYADKIAYARGGKKFVTDTQLPYIVRDWSKIPAGEMLVGDGHTLDFMIKDPYTGKAARATLVGFVDCATRDLAGYEIMMSENTQCIASALRNAIKYIGKTPKVIHLDNGRAFKSKFFNNSNLDNPNLNGIYARLGIKTYYSRAYNGRAKVIERFFKEFTESLAKLISSYCGGSIETKPAYMMRNEKDHIELRNLNGSDCPTIEEVKTYIDFWLENIYRKRACNFDKSKTIEEVINSSKGKGVPESLLNDMLCGYDKRKVGRNGIVLFSQQYYNPKLQGLTGEVIVKYSLVNLNYVIVCNLKGEVICRADRVKAICAHAEVFGTPQDMAEYKQQLREIKQIEKSRLSGVKKQLKQLYGNPIANSVPDLEPEKKRTTKLPKINYDENILNMMPDTQNNNQFRCISINQG